MQIFKSLLGTNKGQIKSGNPSTKQQAEVERMKNVMRDAVKAVDKEWHNGYGIKPNLPSNNSYNPAERLSVDLDGTSSDSVRSNVAIDAMSHRRVKQDAQNYKHERAEFDTDDLRAQAELKQKAENLVNSLLGETLTYESVEREALKIFGTSSQKENKNEEQQHYKGRFDIDDMLQEEVRNSRWAEIDLVLEQVYAVHGNYVPDVKPNSPSNNSHNHAERLSVELDANEQKALEIMKQEDQQIANDIKRATIKHTKPLAKSKSQVHSPLLRNEKKSHLNADLDGVASRSMISQRSANDSITEKRKRMDQAWEVEMKYQANQPLEESSWSALSLNSIVFDERKDFNDSLSNSEGDLYKGLVKSIAGDVEKAESSIQPVIEPDHVRVEKAESSIRPVSIEPNHVRVEKAGQRKKVEKSDVVEIHNIMRDFYANERETKVRDISDVVASRSMISDEEEEERLHNDIDKRPIYRHDITLSKDTKYIEKTHIEVALPKVQSANNNNDPKHRLSGSVYNAARKQHASHLQSANTIVKNSATKRPQTAIYTSVSRLNNFEQPILGNSQFNHANSPRYRRPTTASTAKSVAVANLLKKTPRVNNLIERVAQKDLMNTRGAWR